MTQTTIRALYWVGDSVIRVSHFRVCVPFVGTGFAPIDHIERLSLLLRVVQVILCFTLALAVGFIITARVGKRSTKRRSGRRYLGRK